MGYSLKIEVYTLIHEDFVTPLAEAPDDLRANYKYGDYVIIIGNDVWVTNRNLEGDDEYSKAAYSPAFVRINPGLFEKVETN
jgi:hypothetical protein